MADTLNNLAVWLSTPHQAMIEIATDQQEPGTIVEEMQAGYMLKDRLLRPALVAVAKAG